MFVQPLIVGLVALTVGAVFCFAGYRLFRILIAVWGFFAGFLIGAQAVTSLFGGSFLANALGWGVGIALGILLAGLAYLLYSAAIAILGASVGYLIGIGIMTALGFDGQAVSTFLAGVLVAILFGVLILLLNLAKILIIINTALGGSSALVFGVLYLFGLVPLDFLRSGLIGAFIKGSPIWGLAWLVVALLGFAVQLQSTQHYRMEDYTPPAQRVQKA
ncbi:MAG TPA: DUF4203 domain-containing protein [Ktedonobacteraceae bacterium]|nr:DUF4203 domain-containing protein [Ktedonobacteraceae bacterium]